MMADETAQLSDDVGSDTTEQFGRQIDDTDRQTIELHDGTSLTAEDAGRIVRSGGGELVVLAGFESAGKTTLIASAYQKFLDGKFADCSFRGSRTLPAFEDRCYRARIASQSPKPVTARTEQSEGLQILHLNLEAHRHGLRSVNLLFADMAGEFYSRALDGEEECRNLSIVKRADYLVILIDGKSLSDPRQREVALHDTKLLLRRFVECEMIGKWTSVQVVTSKWDLVLTSQSESEVQRRMATLESQIDSWASGRFRSLTFAQVAASPAAKPDLMVAYGVEALFCQWVAPRAWNSPDDSLSHRPLEDTRREADRFRARHQMEKRP